MGSTHSSIVYVPLLMTALWAPWARAASDARTELTPVPIVGGNSDVGFGGGVLLSLARIEPNEKLFRYRLEFATVSTFHVADGRVTVPYHDSYLLLELPHLVPKRLEFRMRASYTREATLKYYGIGNAAALEPALTLTDPYYEYGRVHPEVSAEITPKIGRQMGLELGIRYGHNWLSTHAPSKLLDDRVSTNPVVRAAQGPLRAHGQVVLSYGVSFDTRDDRVAPTLGQYHSFEVALAPGGTEPVPYRFARVTVSVGGYTPLIDRHVVLAARLVGDSLWGDPPVYELARFDNTTAIGGPRGVRGVPGQRYHGKDKVLGNVELRTRWLDFDLLGKTNTLGFSVFADAGRVWAEHGDDPELDGTGLGLKWGFGGGPRIKAGKSFVFRVDLTTSRERPFGALLASGHAF